MSAHSDRATALLTGADQANNTVTQDRLLAAAQVHALLDVADAIRQAANS